MTKRFIISYSLITLFLLSSVVLFAQCENAFAQQWKIEDASHALQVIERTDTLELIVPDGLTMWYQQRLAGNYEVSYRTCIVFGLPMTLNTQMIFSLVVSGATASLKTTTH